MPEGGLSTGLQGTTEPVLHVRNTNQAPRLTHALQQAERPLWAYLLAGAELPEPPVLGQNIQGCLLPLCH